MPKTLPTMFCLLVLTATSVAQVEATPQLDCPPSGAFGLEAKIKSVPRGAAIRWKVSPEPAGMLIRPIAASHSVVIAGPQGNYKLSCELIRGTVDADGKTVLLEGSILEAAFSLTGAPGPKPDPIPPGPTPVPPGPTPPKPTAAKFLVIIEETAEAAAGRGALLTDKAFAAQLQARGMKARVVDKDAVGPDGRPPADVARFITDAKAKGLPRVYLLDKDGKEVYSGNAPDTALKLVALLEKYGS